jgi:NAD(P)-dependent dehydrogenase (short-subunit alcohol dehydrogenase family)
LSLFYDLAKTSVIRMASAQAKELRPHRCTAVALTPGWLPSEQMLDNYGVSEASWRDAIVKQPHPSSPKRRATSAVRSRTLPQIRRLVAGMVSRFRVASSPKSMASPILTVRSKGIARRPLRYINILARDKYTDYKSSIR